MTANEAHRRATARMRENDAALFGGESVEEKAVALTLALRQTQSVMCELVGELRRRDMKCQ